MAGSREYGDKPSGSGTTELVKYQNWSSTAEECITRVTCMQTLRQETS